MGNSTCKDIKKGNKSSMNPIPPSKPKILCLHGWRTSGDILSCQMAAMIHHTDADYVFVTAPHSAVGEPDPGIAMFYPDRPYFEWYLQENGSTIDESIDWLLSYINENGPFDGILGFSQGASMVTRLLRVTVETRPFKFAILIGGVVSKMNDTSDDKICFPSLHLYGSADPLYESCKNLEKFYDENQRTSMEHNEGHNIPSIRTTLYPSIKTWIYEH